MALFDLPVFDLSWITTDDPDGFSDNGGYQFDMGVSTVTINPSAVAQILSVEDNTNTFFDDDDGTQVLNGGATINGVFFPDGTAIESEYEIVVEDSLGNPYTLQFISVDADAYDIRGFVIQGDVPPFGEPLTVVGRGDGTSGVHSYSTATPACFAANTRIATDRGPVAVEDLRPGDSVCLATGGTAPIRLVLSQTVKVPETYREMPVRLRGGSMGDLGPSRDLILSPQHRIYIPEFKALAPARALTLLPRVGLLKRPIAMTYFHIVMDRHNLILAEDMICESFWPGPMAFGTLPKTAQQSVYRIMGANARPAAPMLTMRQARRALRKLIDAFGPDPLDASQGGAEKGGSGSNRAA
ncbi:MAG: Hint domain-containing protein [Pseudooceanicola sp.]